MFSFLFWTTGALSIYYYSRTVENKVENSFPAVATCFTNRQQRRMVWYDPILYRRRSRGAPKEENPGGQGTFLVDPTQAIAMIPVLRQSPNLPRSSFPKSLLFLIPAVSGLPFQLRISPFSHHRSRLCRVAINHHSRGIFFLTTGAIKSIFFLEQ